MSLSASGTAHVGATALEADLRKVAPHSGFPLDIPGWFGGQ